MSVTFLESNTQQHNHSLQNMENYKLEFSSTSTEIFSKYIGILSEYFINCSETINIQNETYYKYVIIKGMETVAHVFRMLLLYTKNLNLTYYHCQKSFYYYVEFISQIGDNNHSFLQLNSRDASLFVYKKTIYEINQEVRKTFSSTVQDNMIMNNIEILIYMYNSFLSEKLDMIIFSSKNNTKEIVVKSDDNEIKKVKKCDFRLLTIDKDAIRLAQLILNVSLLGDEKYYYEMLQLIKLFFDSSIWYNKCELNSVDNHKFVDVDNKSLDNKYIYMDIFIKKIKKNVVSIDYLEKRFRHEENDNKFETLTPLRYINWLMSGAFENVESDI
jgi:hypothetical protein